MLYDRHPKFSLTFNFRGAEGQARQLHELPNIGRNGSWEAAGRHTQGEAEMSETEKQNQARSN